MLTGPMGAALKLTPLSRRKAKRRRAPAPRIDTAWFHERIAATGRSINDTARLMIGRRGRPLDPSALVRTLNGERALRIEEARQLAELVKAPIAEVLAHAGVETAEGAPQLHLVGTIDADGAVTAAWKKPSALRLAAPPDAPADAVALSFRSGDHLDGAVLVCRRPGPVTPDAVGRAAVIVLEEGGTVYGVLRRSQTRGRYSVQVAPGMRGGQRLDDVAVAAVGAALWVKLP